MFRLLYPMRTYLIVSGGKDEYNVMTADWVTMISKKPFIVGVSISPKRYTHKLMVKYREFVISVPTIELLRDVWIAGNESGPGKIRKMGLTFIDSKIVGTPSIKECIGNLECKIIEYKDYGDHTFFIGRVVAYTYNEDAFKNDLPSLEHKYILHVGLSKFTVNSAREYNASGL